VKGQFYYLYMAMDVWSRRIIGVEVHECEAGELAKNFFDRICRDEGIREEDAAVLHSDNGAPSPQASRRIALLNTGRQNVSARCVLIILQARRQQ
jgi:putative transposase